MVQEGAADNFELDIIDTHKLSESLFQGQNNNNSNWSAHEWILWGRKPLNAHFNVLKYLKTDPIDSWNHKLRYAKELIGE